MDSWYSSVKRQGLHALVFHDGLPDSLLSTFDADVVRFAKVPSVYPFSTNDFRFFVYNDFLQASTLNQIYFTDISDVVIPRNPFPISRSDTLYVGDNAKSFSENTYLMSSAIQTGNIKYVDFLKEHAGKKSVNAGILGGDSSLITQFLCDLVNEIRSVNRPWHNVNMLCFNYVAYTKYESRIDTSLCSNYKQYEHWRKDVPFIHK